jgi:hypothetical protein
MTKQHELNFGLKFIANGVRLGRLVILFGIVPIGIVGLVLGVAQIRDAYLYQQLQIGTWGLGLTSLGGAVVVGALLLILLLYLLERRIALALRDKEYSARGRNSIQRLMEWVPKDSEHS